MSLKVITDDDAIRVDEVNWYHRACLKHNIVDQVKASHFVRSQIIRL